MGCFTSIHTIQSILIQFTPCVYSRNEQRVRCPRRETRQRGGGHSFIKKVFVVFIVFISVKLKETWSFSTWTFESQFMHLGRQQFFSEKYIGQSFDFQRATSHSGILLNQKQFYRPAKSWLAGRFSMGDQDQRFWKTVLPIRFRFGWVPFKLSKTCVSSLEYFIREITSQSSVDLFDDYMRGQRNHYRPAQL